MMSADSLFLEVAIVNTLFAVGNILLGHFEEGTPKWKRLAKFIITLVLIVGLSYLFDRTVAYIALGILMLPVIYIHAIDLPKKGINGWTGEPKDKYYELRGWDKGKLTK